MLRPKKQSIARDSQGIFRIAKHLGDVDIEIRDRSKEKCLGEANEICRR